jgi:hypothetical protein
MATSLERLRTKLGRELAQAEHDAIIHCEREAGRYGHLPPGEAFRAIADHAREVRPQLAAVWGDQPTGVRAGRVVAEVFSAVRQFALDRVTDAERSYRATLLGLRHGVDVVRLMREVLVRQHDHEPLRVCNELLERRLRLLGRAEERLRWFAEHPDVALRSSRNHLVAAAEQRQLRATSKRPSTVR